MADPNPNCDGGRCRSATGQVRVYPIGGGGNLILCRYCWNYENAFRQRRDNPAAWPQVQWDTAKIYGETEPMGETK
jgi:hypothetical protein